MRVSEGLSKSFGTSRHGMGLPAFATLMRELAAREVATGRRVILPTEGVAVQWVVGRFAAFVIVKTAVSTLL